MRSLPWNEREVCVQQRTIIVVTLPCLYRTHNHTYHTPNATFLSFIRMHYINLLDGWAHHCLCFRFNDSSTCSLYWTASILFCSYPSYLANFLRIYLSIEKEGTPIKSIVLYVWISCCNKYEGNSRWRRGRVTSLWRAEKKCEESVWTMGNFSISFFCLLFISCFFVLLAMYEFVVVKRKHVSAVKMQRTSGKLSRSKKIIILLW